METFIITVKIPVQRRTCPPTSAHYPNHVFRCENTTAAQSFTHKDRDRLESGDRAGQTAGVLDLELLPHAMPLICVSTSEFMRMFFSFLRKDWVSHVRSKVQNLQLESL
jgi:hypothetical protein